MAGIFDLLEAWRVAKKEHDSALERCRNADAALKPRIDKLSKAEAGLHICLDASNKSERIVEHDGNVYRIDAGKQYATVTKLEVERDEPYRSRRLEIRGCSVCGCDHGVITRKDEGGEFFRCDGIRAEVERDA